MHTNFEINPMIIPQKYDELDGQKIAKKETPLIISQCLSDIDWPIVNWAKLKLFL